MNQFPYLYPHSLSEAERLNEEELWQDTVICTPSILFSQRKIALRP